MAEIIGDLSREGRGNERSVKEASVSGGNRQAADHSVNLEPEAPATGRPACCQGREI
jgi:hypothetical protein